MDDYLFIVCRLLKSSVVCFFFRMCVVRVMMF
jgi:hypothetical protein